MSLLSRWTCGLKPRLVQTLVRLKSVKRTATVTTPLRSYAQLGLPSRPPSEAPSRARKPGKGIPRTEKVKKRQKFSEFTVSPTGQKVNFGLISVAFFGATIYYHLLDYSFFTVYYIKHMESEFVPDEPLPQKLPIPRRDESLDLYKGRFSRSERAKKLTRSLCERLGVDENYVCHVLRDSLRTQAQGSVNSAFGATIHLPLYYSWQSADEVRLDQLRAEGRVWGKVALDAQALEPEEERELRQLLCLSDDELSFGIAERLIETTFDRLYKVWLIQLMPWVAVVFAAHRYNEKHQALIKHTLLQRFAYYVVLTCAISSYILTFTQLWSNEEHDKTLELLKEKFTLSEITAGIAYYKKQLRLGQLFRKMLPSGENFYQGSNESKN